MNFSWSFSDKLVTASGSHRESEAEGQQGNDVFFHPTILQQNFQFDNEFIRQLIHEFYSVFAKLRAFANDPSNGNTLASIELQKVSLHYQTIIRSKLLRSQKEENEELTEMLKSVHLIWSLIDVLLLKTAESLPSVDLIDWSKFNFNAFDKELENLFVSLSRDSNLRLDSHPDYWKMVYSCLIFGRIDDCRRLLNANVRRMDPIFLSVDDLLQRIPLAEEIDRSEWYSWQNECKQRLAENLFVVYPEVKIVVQVLSGDPLIFEELVNMFDFNWYQMIIGKTLFCHTFCKIYELTDIATSLFTLNQNQITPIDEILLSIFELDVVKTLKLCSSHFRNWVFVAHLADLLHFAGCTELALIGDNIDLREYLLLEYANSLITHESLWQLAAEYYASCPTYGVLSLKLNLERMPVDSDYKYMKVLEICKKFEFLDVARSLSKERCIKALKCGQLNKALSYCLQTKDSTLAGYLAQQFLKTQGRSGLIHTLKLLDDLGSNALLNSSLTFLGKYREFWRLRGTGTDDFSPAAVIMAQLINSRLAPRQFWPILFEDLLMLMKSAADQKHLFNSDDLFALINSVENADIELDLLKNSCIFGSSKAKKQGQQQQLKTAEDETDDFRNIISDLRLFLSKQLVSNLVS